METAQAAIHHDPVLRQELQSSHSDFFRGEVGLGGDEDARLADRRHLEWFLIERANTPTQQQRIASLLERCARESGADPASWIASLEDSHASVFEVTAVEAGACARLEDLAGPFECSALAPEGSPAWAVGDLIAGRVFPIDDRLHAVSRAASRWRSAPLLAAVRADFERARSERSPRDRKRSTLGQSEIEAIIRAWTGKARGERRRFEGAIDQARRLFLDNGLSPDDADEFLEWLAREAPDPTRILPGGDDVLREVLDTLAFETSVDLDAARMILIDAWEEMHSVAREPARLVHRDADPSAPPTDVATAIAEFDRKRSEGTPLDQAIRDLEHDLDLEASASSEESEDATEVTPDLPGVVGGVVEEFLWEEGLVHGTERAQRYRILRGLGGSAERISNIEDLGRLELTNFACRWVIEAGALRAPEDAEILLEGLGRFCRWAEENHDVRIQGEFGPVLEGLRESLPRLALANRACPAASTPNGSEWLEIKERRGSSEALMADLTGKEMRAQVNSSVLEHLHPGDWVRGQGAADRGFVVEACYPAEVREVLGA